MKRLCPKQRTGICLAVSLLATLFLPAFVSDSSLAFSNSPIALAFWAALYALLRRVSSLKPSVRERVCSGILGFLFAGMTAAGYALDHRGDIFYTDPPFLAGIVLYAYVMAKAISLLWFYLARIERLLSARSLRRTKAARLFEFVYSRPVLIALAIFICWLPCYLSDFPGGFRYDATAELYQSTNGYLADYPMLHSALVVLIIGGLHRLTGSYDLGIAVFTIAQMAMISCMYAHILWHFFRRGIDRALLFTATLYCALFPVVQMLVTQEVRDVLFSALFTYTVFWFYRLSADGVSFMRSKRNSVILATLTVLTIYARNNNSGMAIPLALLAVCVLAIALCRGFRRQIVRLAAAVIAGYVCLGAVLSAICQPISPPTSGVSLSLCSQSLARAYLRDRESWSEEDVAELSKYLHLDGLVYLPHYADPTNRQLVPDAGFFRFWLKMGLKHPGEYADAILANTEKMWFPASVVDSYIWEPGVGPYAPFEKSYYAFTDGMEEPATFFNLLPSVHEFYKKLGLYISFEKIPVVSMLFSIGFQFWLMLLSFFYLLSRRKKRLYLPVALLLGYMLFSAFVPLVILRYFAAAFISMPLLLILTLQPGVASGDEPQRA